ncbi:hypothetical protein DFJ74DRAFT_665739 [Hyaloraphidium curvatum]|nr:hypothetical protein DFJ74DRAFT_665739 [Hyaloraphidium curvatum]
MRIRRGSNLGFPCWEARARALDGAQDMPICQRIYNEGAESVGYPRVRLEDVLFVYPHDGTSAASIGGVILPSYFPGGWANHFIFTDYARGTMWTVNPANPGDVKVFAEGADNIVSFRTSPFDGYVYMVLQCRGCGSNGRIRRLEVRGYRPPTITSGPKQTTTKRAAGPVNTLCSPPNRIRVSPLPREPDGQQWETVMWLSKGNFPRSRLSVAMNGGWGPIGMDTSVGPAPNSANSRSRVISVGREFFTAGLGTKAYSVIDLNLGAAGRCWKFVADVGIDDEIHIGRGEQAAWAEFVVRTGQSNGLRLLYSTTDVRQAQGLAPLRARDPAWRISITNLTRWSGLRLVGNRPDPARYPFDFDNAHLDWASARLYCGPEAPYLPDVQITAPTGAPEAAIGQTVQFSGRATNWDGTEITAAASFEWNVVLVHCQGYLCHQHSEVDGLRGRQGSFVVGDHAPTAEQYYFYQIDLVVRDACGRSDRATKTVKVRGFSGER